MTIEEFRETNPGYGYDCPDNVIEECLIRAEYIVNVLSRGCDIDPACREEAIAAQTRFLLNHYGEERGDCEETCSSVISELYRGGLSTEVLYGKF